MGIVAADMAIQGSRPDGNATGNLFVTGFECSSVARNAVVAWLGQDVAARSEQAWASVLFEQTL
jgi:hypothetical protein